MRRKNGINMAAEIRDILAANPQARGADVREALHRKFPRAKFSPGSVNVAFSQARKRAGIAPGPRQPPGRTNVRANGSRLNLGTLTAARDFVREAGDSETAIEAVKQLESLQLA